MEGDAQQRHCHTCDKKVHNLSNMTEHEAALFVDAHRGKHACIQAQLDADGFVKFAQPRGPRLPTPPRLTVAAAALTLPMLLAGCAGETDDACDVAVAQEPGQGEPSLFSDPHHPRHSVAAYSTLPEHRRSLLLRILRSNPVQRRFEEANQHVQGGASFK
jgi:hypothetical protein